mgnify:CR=1 FL=1
MAVEIFILDGNGGFRNIFGKIGEFYGSAVFAGINLIKKETVAIKNFGGDRIVMVGEGFGVWQSREERNGTVRNKNKKKTSEETGGDKEKIAGKRYFWFLIDDFKARFFGEVFLIGEFKDELVKPGESIKSATENFPKRP